MGKGGFCLLHFFQLAGVSSGQPQVVCRGGRRSLHVSAVLGSRHAVNERMVVGRFATHCCMLPCWWWRHTHGCPTFFCTYTHTTVCMWALNQTTPPLCCVLHRFWLHGFNKGTTQLCATTSMIRQICVALVRREASKHACMVLPRPASGGAWQTGGTDSNRQHRISEGCCVFCVCSAEVYSFLASRPLHLCGRVGCLLVVTAVSVCRAAGRVLLCRGLLLLSDYSWAASWQACRDGLFVGLTLSRCTLQLQL